MEGYVLARQVEMHSPESILVAASVMEGWLPSGAALLPSPLAMPAKLPDTLPLPLVRRPSTAGAELAGSVRLLLAATALSSIAGVGGSGVGSACKDLTELAHFATQGHVLAKV